MLELGIILIGTGLIIIGSARAMVRSTKKILDKNTFYNDVDSVEEQQKRNSKSEEELKGMVRRSMSVLYVVGLTCMGLGLLLLMYASGLQN